MAKRIWDPCVGLGGGWGGGGRQTNEMLNNYLSIASRPLRANGLTFSEYSEINRTRTLRT